MDGAQTSGVHREDTGALLVAVAARLNRLYGKALAQLEVSLTFRQQRLLMRVREGHSSLATLAAFGNLTVPTVSESIDVLVRRKLLTRKENPQSRRSQVLTLTSLGHEALDAAENALREVNGYLLGDLPEDRQDLLRDSLEVVFENATTLFRADGVPDKNVQRSRKAGGPDRAATH